MKWQYPVKISASRHQTQLSGLHQIHGSAATSLLAGDAQRVEFDVGLRLSLQGIATSLSPAIPGSTLLLFQDLTRQHQIENMRRDFISNVSHELRTPLAALKALTETLLSGALDDPPAARRFLEQMETEVDSLSLMVNELLELSRIESGRVPLNIVPTRPIDIIQRKRCRLLTANAICHEQKHDRVIPQTFGIVIDHLADIFQLGLHL